MSKTPEDEKVGPFYIRARALKGVWTSIAIDGDKIAGRFEGHETEDAALGAARAYAVEQAALRRPPPRAPGKRVSSAERRSLEELRAKFVKHFPGGFTDAGYLAKERDEKLAVRDALLAAMPLAAARSAGPAEAAAVRPLFGKIRLSPFEIIRAQKTLDSADGPAFVRACAQLAAGGDAKAALAAIDAAVRPHGAPSWTIATYLPSLWAPETCMLMRITATTRVSNWLGHDFASQYRGQLDADVHAAFIAFAHYLKDALADMSPRDLIDVQGFIWVVSEYD